MEANYWESYWDTSPVDRGSMGGGWRSKSGRLRGVFVFLKIKEFEYTSEY